MDETKQYPDILAEQEHDESKEFLNSLGWLQEDLTDYWLDLTEDYKRPRYTLSFRGVPFAPLGGIHALTGQAGHGKTAFFTMLMVAILKGEYCGFKYELAREIPNPKVLYIDTEMEKGNTQLVVKRLYKMMGWNKQTQQEQFKVLRLREEDNVEKRWLKTLKAIYEIRPTVVFLDGIIDVIADFNDNKECSTRIYQDMKAASFYNLSFWNLLHQNPGSTKMVGHTGSFLERKGTDVFMVIKDKEGNVVSFKFKQLKARGKDVPEANFIFQDDDEHLGIPIVDEETPTTTTEQKKGISPEEAVSVIGTETMSWRSLREKIKKQYNIGSDKAAALITEACNQGILTIDDNKYTANPTDRFAEPSNDLPF